VADPAKTTGDKPSPDKPRTPRTPSPALDSLACLEYTHVRSAGSSGSGGGGAVRSSILKLRDQSLFRERRAKGVPADHCELVQVVPREGKRETASFRPGRSRAEPGTRTRSLTSRGLPVAYTGRNIPRPGVESPDRVAATRTIHRLLKTTGEIGSKRASEPNGFRATSTAEASLDGKFRLARKIAKPRDERREDSRGTFSQE